MTTQNSIEWCNADWNVVPWKLILVILRGLTSDRLFLRIYLNHRFYILFVFFRFIETEGM